MSQTVSSLPLSSVRPATAPDLWFTRCPLPTAFSIAVHTGRLHAAAAARGIRLHSLRASASETIRRAHFTQSHPGTIRQGGHIPPLWSRAEGRDVRLVGLSWTDEGQYVLVDPSSGIETVADLKGRRLAVPLRPGLPVDFWRATVLRGFAGVLGLAGLTLADVTLVPLDADSAVFRAPPPGIGEIEPPGAAEQTLTSMQAEARALVRGEVDAIFAPAHYGAALRRVTGARVLEDLSRLPRGERLNNPTLLALTVEGSALEADREGLAHVLAAVLEAGRWAGANRREAARIVAAESGNAESLVEEIFGPRFADDLDISLDADRLGALQRQNRFLLEHGFVARLVPAEEWSEPALLARARAIAAGTQA